MLTILKILCNLLICTKIDCGHIIRTLRKSLVCTCLLSFGKTFVFLLHTHELMLTILKILCNLLICTKIDCGHIIRTLRKSLVCTCLGKLLFSCWMSTALPLSPRQVPLTTFLQKELTTWRACVLWQNLWTSGFSCIPPLLRWKPGKKLSRGAWQDSHTSSQWLGTSHCFQRALEL